MRVPVAAVTRITLGRAVIRSKGEMTGTVGEPEVQPLVKRCPLHVSHPEMVPLPHGDTEGVPFAARGLICSVQWGMRSLTDFNKSATRC
jgi:hypothetical protein